jgi:hypothetical protein
MHYAITMLEALERLTENEPIENDSDYGECCFYCRAPVRVVNRGGSLTEDIKHIRDCEWIQGLIALGKDTKDYL